MSPSLPSILGSSPLEQVSTCPCCGGREFQHYLESKDFLVTGEAFGIVRCRGCGLRITSPRPAPNRLPHYYRSDKYLPHQAHTRNLFGFVYRQVRYVTLRRKLRVIDPFKNKGRLLDFGCGTGEFLAVAKHRGWTPEGVEPDASAAGRARKLTGAEITPVLNANRTYDVITLWHVLEHIRDPVALLTDLRRCLPLDGMLAIAVPNPNAHDALHYQEFWAGYDLPRHLWHYDSGNTKRLLTMTGFKVLSVLPMKLDAYYVAILSEEYMTGKKSLVRAAQVAFRSNSKARKTGEYSSLTYLAKAC